MSAFKASFAAGLLALSLGCAADLDLGATDQAITNGTLDGDDHPYVGLVLLGDTNHIDPVENPNGAIWRCSGALISPTVFLTAGHCTGEYPGYAVPDSAWIWFDSDVDATGYPLTGYAASGVPIPHPAYDDFAGFPNTHDIGIVVLDEPVVMDRYATVADLGYLDALATGRNRHNARFDAVGYGMQQAMPIPADKDLADKRRRQATMRLVNLESSLAAGYNLQTGEHPGAMPHSDGTAGGTCFGDSGGPILDAGTDTVVAVVSFGLSMQTCSGTGFHYRADIAESQDFLADHDAL